MDWLLTEIRKEWPLIKGALLLFSIIIVLVSSVIGFVIYQYFRINLEMKNDLIASKNDYIATLEKKPSPIPVPLPIPETGHPIIQSPNVEVSKSLQSPIEITNIVRFPYEAGKPASINVFYSNDRNSIKIRQFNHVVILDNVTREMNRKDIEERLWAIVKMDASNATHGEWRGVPLSKNLWFTLQGPVLTKEQAARLQSGKGSELYYIGMI
jgi:hypothetical protein